MLGVYNVGIRIAISKPVIIERALRVAVVDAI